MAPSTTPPPIRCLNCGHPLAGPYCSQCGQEATEPVPRLGDLLREVVDEFLKVDAKVVRTIRSLARRPGEITAEYAAGKRASYVAPFKLYFATSFLYYLLMELLGDKSVDRLTTRKLEGVPDRVNQVVGDGIALYTAHATTIAILLLPLNALALAVVFYNRRQPILLHLVATLHNWSGSVLLYLPFYIGAHLLLKAFPSQSASDAVAPVYFVFMFGYQFVAYRRLFRASRLESAAKSFAVCSWTGLVSLIAFLLFIVGFALYDAGTARAERSRKAHAKEQQISRSDVGGRDGPGNDRRLRQPGE
ncbi:MAG: DUF3667 domain-containing protein [Fimbriimonas sp.]